MPGPQPGAPKRRGRRTDPPGPVVAVCTGSRCLTAHRAGHGRDLDLTGLRHAVRQSRGGVLVSCGCLGRCDLAALVLLGWNGNAYTEFRVLSGMEDADRMATLTTWLPGPGPARSLLDGADLPPALARATAPGRNQSR